MSENVRLQRENALLREHYSLASENLKLASEKMYLEQLVAELSTRSAEPVPVPCVPPWVAMPMMPTWPMAEPENLYPAPPMPPVRWMTGQEGMPVNETGRGRSGRAKRSAQFGGSSTSTEPNVQPHTDEFTETRTTVMLRNLPNNYDRAALLAMFNAEGFVAQYDFVYLPFDFTTGSNLGYAFVNLVNSTQVKRFWNTFEGTSKWTIPSHKICRLSWVEEKHSGFQENIERWRNSPVMHEQVPDEYKPLIFSGTFPVSFPPPTKSIRKPR
eukprot:CAMPEP_0180455326 /NCGR_PEP_ID=MMETSP1036_2-20121128/20737_1 /TAXON_ID=632150 /ORGANISM="Azadinium spinosum, Strain 3D9" /LENGTH=269 /DNA_ID=CAMNT_0022461875 /DNA_START=171 /DNA_END=977 /DNA_ORIENTATION=+